MKKFIKERLPRSGPRQKHFRSLWRYTVLISYANKVFFKHPSCGQEPRRYRDFLPFLNFSKHVWTFRKKSIISKWSGINCLVPRPKKESTALKDENKWGVAALLHWMTKKLFKIATILDDLFFLSKDPVLWQCYCRSILRIRMRSHNQEKTRECLT